MLDLVSDLLDVAKIEAGKFELHKSTADLHSIIADSVAFYTPLAEHITIEARVDAEVPHALEMDARRIAQVLNNLLSNAIKFTPESGRVLVRAASHRGVPDCTTEGADIRWFSHSGVKVDDGKNIVIEVMNTGSEIAAKDLPLLFDKFKQFEAAAKSEKKGTGLGLVIVRGIAGDHGGQVGVASGKEGTSFLFTLPA